MTIHDELSDDQVLRAASASLSERPVADPPDTESIIGRGDTRRRRRRAALTGLSVATLAATATLALALAGTLSPTQTPDTIRGVAFTLISNPDGTTTLRLNPGELFDPTVLQVDLANDGIAAKVTTGSFCTSNPAPAGFAQVVSLPGPGTSQQGSGQSPTITIDPSAMPAGTQLSIGVFQLATGQQQANTALIDTDSYTCTNTPPTLAPDTPGFGALYGGNSDGGHSIQIAPGSN